MDFKEESNELPPKEEKIENRNDSETSAGRMHVVSESDAFFLEDLSDYPAWRMWR